MLMVDGEGKIISKIANKKTLTVSRVQAKHIPTPL